MVKYIIKKYNIYLFYYIIYIYILGIYNKDKIQYI